MAKEPKKVETKAAEKKEADVKVETKAEAKTEAAPTAKIRACTLEVIEQKTVYGEVPAIIMTEFGAKKIGPGTQIKVASSIKNRVMEQYKGVFKVVAELEEVSGLKHGHYEYVKTVEAGKSTGKTTTNKSMADKVVTK